MKKKGVLLLMLIVITIVGIYKIKPYYANVTENAIAYSQVHFPRNIEKNEKHPYYVKSNHKIKGYFNTIEDAIESGNKYKRSIVIEAQNNEWVWNNYAPFLILTEHGVQDFDRLESAIYYAKRNSYRQIYWKNNKNIIWDLDEQLPENILLDVPVILQYPELPRGCEVTSLAMILEYLGIKTNKLELAENIKKDTTPYSKDESGRITFGNPYDGFVGDMYNIRNHGYGVYHGPIVDLLEQYAPGKVIDLTGSNIEDVLYFVAKGVPVWVVANSTYKPLKDEGFEIWHTPTGIVKITYREHAVVITGYSEKNIYLNDPLRSKKNIKVDRKKFVDAWAQMGNQAVVVYEE